MTVASSVSRVSYAGNGSTQNFAVPYYFLENSHLRVVLRSSAGVETVQIITTNYTVTGAGNPAGGQISMVVAPPFGSTLVIVRNVPVTQETDYQANDPFPAESHERALDKLTMITQQGTEIDARSLKIPETETSNTQFPSIPQRQNRYAIFAGNGDAAVSGKTVTEVESAITAMQTALAAAPSSSGAVTHIASGSGATPTTVQSKLREIVSVKDFGAVGDGVTDDVSAIQTALNNRSVTVPEGIYNISAPLKVLMLSKLSGPRAGMSFIGNGFSFYSGIAKTTNTTVNITPSSTNIDCIAYIDPDYLDGKYPQKTTIESLSFRGNTATPNAYGLWIEEGGFYTFRDLDFANTDTAIYVKIAWLSYFERIGAIGKIIVKDGTSLHFNECSLVGTQGGFDLENLFYSTLTCCTSEFTTESAFVFKQCWLTLNSCGSEYTTSASSTEGTLIKFDGDNRIVVNSYNGVLSNGESNPSFSFGANEKVHFIGGQIFVGTGTAPGQQDIYVAGDNSTIVFEEFTFRNGNDPFITFASGTNNSRVIVKYGATTKVYQRGSTGPFFLDISVLRTDTNTYAATALIGTKSAIPAGSQYGGWGGEKLILQTAFDGAIFSTTGATTVGVPLSSARGNDGTFMDFWRNGVRAGEISVTSGTVQYLSLSDYRLKTNIQPLTNALDTVLRLKPSTFIWKESGDFGKGFIAHELQEFEPIAVSGKKDGLRKQMIVKTPPVVDEQGVEIEPGIYEEVEVPHYQGVDLSLLVPTLTAAIQELKAKIDILENEISALKNKG